MTAALFFFTYTMIRGKDAWIDRSTQKLVEQKMEDNPNW